MVQLDEYALGKKIYKPKKSKPVIKKRADYVRKFDNNGKIRNMVRAALTNIAELRADLKGSGHLTVSRRNKIQLINNLLEAIGKTSVISKPVK